MLQQTNQKIPTNIRSSSCFAISMGSDKYLHGSLRKESEMATLKNRGGSWYARVLWRQHGKKKEKQVPLRTKSKVTARERLAVVSRVENDIKEGMVFTFPWLSDATTVAVKRFRLKDATDVWLKSRKKGGVRQSTLTINQYSLIYLIDCIGAAYPLDELNAVKIEGYIDYLRAKGLNDVSINIHLRTVKAMMRYFLEFGKLSTMPVIKQLKVDKAEPHYITDEEFSKLEQLNSLRGFYKRVFLLYRETGMRLREPMIATLNGNWIDIPSASKSHTARSIEIDSNLRAIFMEFKTWLDEGYGAKLKDVGGHISKKFKKGLATIGAGNEKHFHSLRHTYAVRSLIKGISIYEVKLLMGHASVTTTEVYSNMNLKRVAQDFSTLVKYEKVDTDMVDTALYDKSYLTQYDKIEA